MARTLGSRSPARIGAIPRRLQGALFASSGAAPTSQPADRETIAQMAVFVLIVDDHVQLPALDGFAVADRLAVHADPPAVVPISSRSIHLTKGRRDDHPRD